jgi:hypothetical protein
MFINIYIYIRIYIYINSEGPTQSSIAKHFSECGRCFIPAAY